MTPAWDKGIQAINRDNYWNAVACGKQGGQNPACVFWDTGLCRNDDFTLAFFTPYKQVAYEVWQAVRHGQEPPTPSYVDAQHTRVTIGVTPIPAAKNPIVSLVIKRGGRMIEPATQSLDGGGGRFIFDFAPFAPTAPITIEMVGRAKTVIVPGRPRRPGEAALKGVQRRDLREATNSAGVSTRVPYRSDATKCRRLSVTITAAPAARATSAMCTS